MGLVSENKTRLFVLFVLLCSSGLLIYLFSASSLTKPRTGMVVADEAEQESPTLTMPGASDQQRTARHASTLETRNKIVADAVSPAFDKQVFLTEQEIAQAEFEEFMQQPGQVLWREQTYSNFPEGMNQFFAMDIVELQQLAEGGNVNAMNVFGTRLVRQDIEPYQGIDWLIEAASHGSQEALWQLVLIYRTGARTIKEDEFASAAWSQVSYMLGDWQALWPQPRAAMREIDLRESLLIDVMAANYYAEINRRHLERTGRSIEVNLRPGYAEALDHFMKYGFDDPK
ncbi:MAG: hypothetical protein AAF446_05335 [Pseudomonadota bacterium]